MTKICRLLALITILLANHMHAQMIAVSDPNFRTRLVTLGYSSCMNTTQDSINASCTAVANATSLVLQNGNIANLSGIEAFTGLSSLDVSNNALTSIPVLPAGISTLNVSDNQLSALQNLPPSLSVLNANTNQISILPNSFPATLTSLDLYGNNLTTFNATLPQNLMHLFVSKNQISTLPTLPNSILNLYCQDNQLTSLPNLPPSLIGLLVSSNQLTSLPALPTSLQVLQCDNNQLATLPIIPNSLTDLICQLNQLTSIPNFSTSLKNLQCHDNAITSLPTLPNTLEYLNCSNNALSTLPNLPSSLKYLSCATNSISTLPTLPNNLLTLQADFNLLTTLPLLPNSLGSLSCNNNNISSIPNFPPNLSMIIINNNQLNSIPSLPQFVQTLHINDNNLSVIPPLNSNLNILQMQNNAISCIPNIPASLTTIILDSTDIKCLPNLSNAMIFDGTGGSALTLPLCGLATPSVCPLAWNIHGQIFFDSNSNCVKDINENVLANQKVLLYNNSGSLIQQTFTTSNGEYTFDVNGYGTYSVVADTTAISFGPSCTAFQSLTSVITALDSTDNNMNIGMHCKGPINEKIAYTVIRTSGLFFPGDTAWVKGIAGQYGLCDSNIGGTLTMLIDSFAHFGNVASTAIIPSFIGIDSIVWTISNFNQVDFQNDFKVSILTDTTASIGNDVCITLRIRTNAIELDSTNNEIQSCFGVSNSYDPNDKRVEPDGNILPNNEWLTYTIRFQNTGNAPAKNIVIRDTLDKDLQFGSFELLDFSHKPNIDINAMGAIKFGFPFINLPDSNSNEPESHGHITYRIKQKPNLPIGATIDNTAFIYFDYNAPVITNTTTTIIGFPESISPWGINKATLEVHPNPVYETLNISLKNGSSDCSLELKNMSGVTLKQMQGKGGTESHFCLDMKNYSAGIYIVTIIDGYGRRISAKVTKMD